MTPEERMAQHEAVMAQIDQRLDRVTARHAALAESVERLVRRQLESLSRQEAATERNVIEMTHILARIGSAERIACSR